MNKINFSLKKDLKQYLNNDFNISIYEELTQKGEWKEVFEPLNFFNIFFENIQIINSNLDSPLYYLTYIKNLEYDSKKLYFLLSKVIELWNSQRLMGDESQRIIFFMSFIEKELSRLSEILYAEREDFFKNEGLKMLENFFDKITYNENYDFEKLIEIIDGFENISEKIKFLINAKNKYLIDDSSSHYDKRFGEKCDIQINTLKELAKIDSNQNKSPLEKRQEDILEPSQNLDEFSFVNNFDDVSEMEIYEYFSKKFVNKKLLEKKDLKQYLIKAFQETTPPKKLFRLERNKTKEWVYNVFYHYFLSIAQKPHGRQKDYVDLLGKYFEGFNSNTIASNWSKNYQSKLY